MTLLDILKTLFTLFSTSVSPWTSPADHAQICSLRKLSATRWEAKITNGKAVRYQVSDIHAVFITLPETVLRS